MKEKRFKIRSQSGLRLRNPFPTSKEKESRGRSVKGKTKLKWLLRREELREVRRGVKKFSVH